MPKIDAFILIKIVLFLISIIEHKNAESGLESFLIFMSLYVPNLDSFITKSRSHSGVQMVDVDSPGIRQILTTLRQGNVVAFASDQVPKKGSGILSKFFSRQIYSIKLLPKLQQKTNCAVHLMYCERMKKGEGFRIHFSDSICLSKETQEGVDKMNIEFEKCIMNIPEQYSWEYKKFKRAEEESIYY